MDRKINWLVMILIVVFLALSVSCGTLLTRGGSDFRAGEQAYAEGNYVDATEKAILALQQNAGFAEAIDLAQRSLPKATHELEAGIKQLESSDQKFKYEDIIPLYEKLKILHDNAKDLNIGLPAMDFSDQLQAAKETAIEDRYQAGIAALKEGGYRNARLAERHLDIVHQKISDYKDLNYYLNQVWETSVASLYVYVADDHLDNLSALVETAFRENRVFSELNQVLPAGSIQTSKNMSVEQITSLAKDEGVDLLLYITGETSSKTSPFASNPKDIYTGVPGIELTASYLVSLNGSWLIIDVATGETLSRNSYSANIGEQLSVNVLNSSDRRAIERPHTLPKRTVPILEVDSIEGPFSPFFRAIMKTLRFQEEFQSNKEYNLKRYQDMGLNDITSALDGIVIYNDVYFLITKDGEFDITNDPNVHWKTLDEYVNLHKQIYNIIEDKTQNNFYNYVSAALNKIISDAANILVQATSGPLTQ